LYWIEFTSPSPSCIHYLFPQLTALRVTRRSVVVGFRDVLAAIYFVVVYRMFRGKITAMSGEYGD